MIKHKGDYVGALKGNQGNLYNDVIDYLDDEISTIFKLLNWEDLKTALYK